LGYLIPGENDGRVDIKSVEFDNMKDFIKLNYGHKEIHHKKETAHYVDLFIKTGSFKK
jgi:hypothetical protein